MVSPAILEGRHVRGVADFPVRCFWIALDEKQLAIFAKHTGHAQPDPEGYSEVWGIMGRSAGKSLVAALCAVYLSVFKTYQTVPGESLVGLILASDLRQAKIVHGYIKAFFTVPELARLVVNETASSITINNGGTILRIETHASDFRSIRGFSMAFLIADEIAFWQVDETAASPDVEVLNACRPALGRVAGSKMLCISSPYSEKGEMYRAYREHWGKDSPVLCWRAATREMNKTFSEKIVKRALAEDSARASAEYLAEFRADLADFISRVVVESCVVPQRKQLPAGGGFGIQYKGFYDASGGVRDSAVLAISHHANGLAILDLIHEVEAPFSPAGAVFTHAQILKQYNVFEVWGDKYGGTWCQDEFRRCGVEYRFTELDRSAIYLFALATINSGRCELLDDERLVNQLCGLKRRTGTTGRDTIDHSAGAHDDRANAACGSLFLARDSGVDNGLIDYEKAALAGRYDNETDAAKRFREGWVRAEHNLRHYAGAPIKETWAAGIRGFRFGEMPPACPACDANATQKLLHGECRCQLCGKQWWISGTAPAVNYGPNRKTYEPSRDAATLRQNFRDSPR